MSIRFDSNGNIDPSSLEDDLMNALDSDCKYKQTDNMKKRAIRVAKSYDEFKNMVACAHLKTVSREEIESLKAVKKGWKKRDTSLSNGKMTLLLDEDENKKEIMNGLQTNSDVFVMPKSSIDFERTWRRIQLPTAKYEYLSNVGRNQFSSLFSRTCDVETLEDIVSVILSDIDGLSQNASNTEKLEWLRLITNLSHYKFNSKFFDAELINRIRLMMESIVPP